MFKVFQLFRKKKKRINKKQILFTTIVLGVISVAFFVSYGLSQESNIVVLDINLGSDNYDAATKTFYDRSGLNNDGVSANNTTFTTGSYGSVDGAMSFNGTSDYIGIESSNVFTTGVDGAFTYSAWIKSSDYSLAQTVISRTNPCSNPGHFDIYVNNNKVYLDYYSNLQPGSASHYSANTVLEDGNFHHIVWTKTWGQLGAKLYVDGVSVDILGDSSKQGTTYNDPIFIGAQNRVPGFCEGTPSPSRFFYGLMDNVRIYNYVLSDEEVKNLYDSGRSVANGTSLRKGLVGHWSMDQNTYVEGTENLVNISEWEAHGSSWVNSGDHYLGRDVFKNTVTNPDVGNNYGFRVVNKNISISKHNLTLSFYAKLIGDSGGMSGYAKVYYTDGTNQNHSWSYTPNIFSNFSTYQNKWTYVTATVNLNTSKTPNYISHIYVYKDFVSAGAEMDICCIQVEEKAKATPYTEGIRDGRLTDFSPYSNHGDTGIEQSFVFTEDRFGKEGGAMSFDGSGTTDGVTFGNNIVVPESVTDTRNCPNGCTYSIWLNVDTDAVDRMSLFRGASTIRHIELYSSGKRFRTEAGRQNGYSFGTGTFPDDVRGVWSHFVIVFANNEANRPVRWYQNGELFHTGYMTNGTYPDTEYFSFGSIGRSTGTTSYNYAKSFDGSIDDVRIYNRALSESEIKSLHSSYSPKTTTGSLQKGLVLDMPLKSGYVKSETSGSEIMTDITPYSNHGQNYGATINDEGSDFVESTDYISFNSIRFNDGEEHSGSAWMKWNEGGSRNTIPFGDKGQCDNAIYIYPAAFYFRPEGISGVVVTSWSGEIFDGNWHLVTWTIDSSKLIKVYLDGELIGSKSFSSYSTQIDYTSLGTGYCSSSYTWGGNISNLQIYNRALSDEEVKMIYDRNRSDAGIIFQSQN